MTVYDPIYGTFGLPRQLSELLRTPEVRRLSQVRLLNTLTPTLPTLGDLRRYSHTLGVLHLATINTQPGFSDQESSAFAACVILHDIGTPPFGHLMEYHLRERWNWSHENVIRAIVWGFHAPENRAHQIFAGRTVEVRNVIRRARLSMDIIQAIITREHPLAALLFGTLDLDNIDNVTRMAWALGLRFDLSLATSIARSLHVSHDGKLLLPEKARPVVEEWAALRRKVYEILIFDGPTVASQAVLSEAIETGLDAGVLTADDWALYDELLLERLRTHEKTKHLISRHYLGTLPQLLFAIQISGELADYGLETRAKAKMFLEQALAEYFGTGNFLAYVFVDRGSFEKRLDFIDPVTNKTWMTGETSRSFVVYAFAMKSRVPYSRAMAAANNVATKIRADSKVIRCMVGEPRVEAQDGDKSQLTLPA